MHCIFERKQIGIPPLSPRQQMIHSPSLGHSVTRWCELNYGQQFLETIQNGGRIPVNAVYKQLENSTIH